MKRLAVAILVGLTACAGPVLREGERICDGDKATCDRLFAVSDSLNTPDMVRAICAAGADTKACK